MTPQHLITALNSAIENNSLSLTTAIKGISWTSDIATTIQSYLKVSSLGITATSLAAKAAAAGAVQVGSKNTPSVVLSGKPTGKGSILGIALADIDIILYATPTTDEKIDFTIILQFANSGNNGFSGWTPADSFTGLKDSKVFEVLIADEKPSFLLSSFVHDQSWNFTGTTAANTFSGVQPNLNLQVPAGISTKMFPPLVALFGEETLAQLYFNGTVDNSKTTTPDPNNLQIQLMAVMGSNYNKGLSGDNGAPIKLEFDLGFEALPATTGADSESDSSTAVNEPGDSGGGTTSLTTQLVLQSSIGPAVIRAVIALAGRTIAFSMEGLAGQPALSISDAEQLFSQTFLKQHLPPSIVKNGASSATSPKQLAAFADDSKCAGESFLERVGIYNLGLTLEIPAASKITAALAKPKITSILLKVGYDCNAIGFPPWFDLTEFFVNWSVENPFTPDSAPTVKLDGDLELLKGDITFDATFAKKTNGGDSPSVSKVATRAVASASESPTSGWVFSIDGDLKETSPPAPPNAIQLTSILDQFESGSKDLPEIDIDALKFSAEPAESDYAISFDIVSNPPWKFLGFANPAFDSLTLDINKKEAVYTGSIDTKFSFASSHPAKAAAADKTIVFELSAERTEESWIFEGKNDDAFTLEDFTTAMGLTNTPEYLKKVDIKLVDIKYTAPITKTPPAGGATAADPPPPEGSSVFDINIDTTFEIVNEELEVTLNFQKEKDSWELDGSLIIGPKPAAAAAASSTPGLEFDFSTSSSKSATGTDTLLKAKLSEKDGQTLNISDFATALGVKAPNLPEALNNIELVEAGFDFETKVGEKTFLFYANSKEYGKLVFAIVKTGETAAASWKSFFGINFALVLDFNKLPIAGKLISKFGTLAVEDIMLAGIAKPLTAEDTSALGDLLKDLSGYPQLPAVTGTIPAEAIFDATVDLNGDKEKLPPIIIPVKGKTAPPANSPSVQLEMADDPPADGGGEVAKSGEQKVGKSFGPLSIQKFNISYADGHIVIDVNGALMLAGMEMSFEGLGIRMKFPPKSISDVSFQLHGLGIDLQKGNLRIAGGFIAVGKEPHPFDSLMGMLAINAGTIGLQAYGGYSTSPESFFIFLHLEIPIGGPPYLFVDGLSGGFGINRNFILPDFAELGTFPLLPSVPNNPIPSGPPSSLDDITQVLTDLAKIIPVDQGAYWIALGLDFTSFELVQVSAILEVTLGKSFEIGLLGNASISIPEPVEPIAFLSINFEVKFVPAEGVFAALGVITPASFIFSKSCQLTGGFAFYIWFSGQHEGDFVVTIGGYHPDFKPPAWYPAVPRLGLKWDLGPLHIQGGSFFALTPHVLMAGLDVSATWSGGPVKAWFDMDIDFILGWKPFFYEAGAYIHLGASVHLLFTVTVHIGADINIWGPKFGGKAKIDLDIISFTIHFGSKGPTPPPIPWGEFKKLMPNSHPKKAAAPATHGLAMTAETNATTPFSVSTITMAAGMIREISKDPLSQNDLTNNADYNWLVDPDHFEFMVTAGVPSNNFAFNAIEARTDKGPNDKLLLTPATGIGEYVLPSDLASFYTNPNKHIDPNDAETIFAYDYQGLSEDDYWWKQEVGVAPVDISSSVFVSTLKLQLFNIGTGQAVPEENVVLTLVSSNSAKSLWGSQVTAKNGSSNLNAGPTIKNTLGGMILTPKVWHPLQTRAINIYELIFQQGNLVNWPPQTAPNVGPNAFEEEISEDGNQMTFTDEQGQTVTSSYRILNTKAFAELTVGQSLISELSTALGLSDLNVNTDAAAMAAPRFQDWPTLALLGEEDNEVV